MKTRCVARTDSTKSPKSSRTDSAASIEQETSDLLRRADGAMYRAKSLGKNLVFVSKVGEDLQPEAAAHAALRK